MKQISTKNKIIGIVSILIIIIGIIVVVVSGFNVEPRYRSYNEIKVYVGEEVDLEKIENIVKEVFGNQNARVQLVEIYKDTFQVSSELITEEQKNAIISKVNELYPVEENTENTETEGTEVTEGTETDGTENTDENTEENVRINSSDVEVQSVNNIRLRDLLKPYILPFAIATVIILVYLGIRYRKLGIVNSVLKPLGILAITQILLFSILAIIRFPMGRFTPSLMIVVYFASILYISYKVQNNK